ncbi:MULTISPECIES: DMT family transporter [Clostridium]|uniref:Permeases of the drug/metabolite transporter superfamily n=1 Tax=Clostridium saccharoperbutylacetonicum N1-4(HMT) TaxID=931276 RepID=M1MXZ0_9CLOT|nr:MULTISPECIES: DMT family transporter [Clostridium]AGF56262.1 permeases of the drug/metabolite transporter superfamily [Clostridium saccharoperbutylacetonicum N1-4(HMT)]NRT62995.1 drug/metabolite transporter (DMT)-like permease [Clostridium saccharoperbutylacetonicum]NSB26352.1 drug/metabolite transporter (DMT)-like permease [Clostridium saccharoperbutylacetonicum]
MNNSHKFIHYLLLFFGVLAISTSAIFVKLSAAPTPIIATYRLLFSTLMILPVVIFNKKYILEIKKLKFKQLGAVFSSGIFLAIHYILWFESLRYTSVASSTVLVTMQPLFAFIGSYFFFGEKLKKLSLFGGLLSILGSCIIGLGDFQIGGIALLGDLLALLAAGVITAYFLIGQSIRQELSLVVYVFICYLSSSVFLIGYSVILGYPLIGYQQSDWLCFLGLAFISTILGQTVLNWLIKWLNASTISMSILGEPVGTCILAYLILGESISYNQILGSIIILLGIGIFLIGKTRRQKIQEIIPNN